MNPETFGPVFVLNILAMGLVLVVVFVWQGFKTWRIKNTTMEQIARDQAYQKLAEEAVSIQKRMAEEQEKIVKDLVELRVRIAAIEKMLREVE